MGQDVYLYGSGNRCRILINLIKNTDFQVCGVIDSNLQKQGSMVENYKILAPEVLLHSSKELVCVTFFSALDEEPIWSILQNEYGIEQERICSFHQLLIEIYKGKNILIPTLQSESNDGMWNYCFDTSWHMGLGGVEAWLKDIQRAFSERDDITINWLTYDDNDYKYGDAETFNVDIINAGIERIIRFLPCVIVFSRVDEMMLSAYLLKKILGNQIKMVMAVHGACDGMYNDILSYRDSIGHYVCVSSGIKNELERREVEPNKISVMTIPVAYKANNSRTYTLDRKKPLLLGYAGRLEVFHKRVDLLIDLVLELEKRKIDYVLSIAGEGTMYLDIKSFIEEHSLCGKVKLLGRIQRSEIPDFWIKEDIALNLSDSEGRPLANMEAMVSGCVPVVTYTSGTMEDVVDGENGFAVSKGDYMAIADKIQYLDEHRELIRQMGQRAKADILPKISMERHLELWRNILHTIS